MMNTVLPFIRKFFTILSTVFLLSNSLFAQNWMSIDRLIGSDWEAGDNIGISIAIDGEYMISGAWWEDNVPFVNSAGAAYVFKKDNMDNWTELTKLVSPNAETLGYFGFSVAIDGEYAAVAAYNEDEDDGTTVTGNAGAVYIYHLESNNWVMDQRLIASDYGQGDLFGYNIALSGNYLLVGAFSDDEDANGNNTMDNAGSAYVFERQPNGDWQEVAKLVASDRAAGDDFGKFVDIREDRAIIGAMNKNDDPNFYFSAGAAYIFERNNSNGAWEEPKKSWLLTEVLLTILDGMSLLMATKLSLVPEQKQISRVEEPPATQELPIFFLETVQEFGKRPKKFMPAIMHKMTFLVAPWILTVTSQ